MHLHKRNFAKSGLKPATKTGIIWQNLRLPSSFTSVIDPADVGKMESADYECSEGH